MQNNIMFDQLHSLSYSSWAIFYILYYNKCNAMRMHVSNSEMQMTVEEAVMADVAKRFSTIVRKRNEAAKEERNAPSTFVFSNRRMKRNLALFNFARRDGKGRKMTGVVVGDNSSPSLMGGGGGGSSRLVSAKENSFLMAQAERKGAKRRESL